MDETKQYTFEELQKMSDEDIYKVGKQEFRIPGLPMMGTAEIRSAVIAHARAQGRLVDADGASVGAVSQAALATGAASAEPATPGKVRVVYPPNDEEMPFAGKTAEQILNALQDVWGIDDDVRVYVNGEEVNELNLADVALEVGDRIEFSRKAGEKGIKRSSSLD